MSFPSGKCFLTSLRAYVWISWVFWITFVLCAFHWKGLSFFRQSSTWEWRLSKDLPISLADHHCQIIRHLSWFWNLSNYQKSNIPCSWVALGIYRITELFSVLPIPQKSVFIRETLLWLPDVHFSFQLQPFFFFFSCDPNSFARICGKLLDLISALSLRRPLSCPHT